MNKFFKPSTQMFGFFLFKNESLAFDTEIIQMELLYLQKKTAMTQRQELKFRYFAEYALLQGIITQSQFDTFTQAWMDKTYDIIQASYTQEALFDEVRKRTHYLGRLSSENPEMQNIFKQIALTIDEEDLFEPYYKQVTLEILDKLAPFTRNLPISYLDRIKVFPSTDGSHEFVKYEYTVQGTDIYQLTEEDTATIQDDALDLEIWTAKDVIDTTGKLVLFIEVYPWMNTNSGITVDAIIFEAIVNGITANWLMYVLPKESEKYAAIYVSKLQQLIETLNKSGVYKRKFVYPQ